MARYWVGVVSKEHVMLGVAQGIAQFCHGKSGPLKRMKKDDWLIYYSPRVRMNSSELVQAFTAIGTLSDDTVYQHEMSAEFKPFRRAVTYISCREVSIKPLISQLEFIKNKTHWGYAFRFGMVEINEADFKIIYEKMTRAEL
jgi:predicted RNA-binding protein